MMDFDRYETKLPYSGDKTDEGDVIRKAYRAKTSELMAQFKADLLEELGLTWHPKADLLYSMAWDEGHSEGLQRVYYCAEELSELLMD